MLWVTTQASREMHSEDSKDTKLPLYQSNGWVRNGPNPSYSHICTELSCSRIEMQFDEVKDDMGFGFMVMLLFGGALLSLAVVARSARAARRPVSTYPVRRASRRRARSWTSGLLGERSAQRSVTLFAPRSCARSSTFAS